MLLNQDNGFGTPTKSRPRPRLSRLTSIYPDSRSQFKKIFMAGTEEMRGISVWRPRTKLALRDRDIPKLATNNNSYTNNETSREKMGYQAM